MKMLDDCLSDPGPEGHLEGMGEKSVPHVAKGDSRIDENASVFGLDQAGESADSQRFGAQDG
jgi:hypothetical protein